MASVLQFGGAMAAGTVFSGVLGAASGRSISERRDDGFSGRDALVTGIATGVFGAAGLGLGALLAASPSTGVAMGTKAGMLVGGGVGAALAASYLVGWSLTN